MKKYSKILAVILTAVMLLLALCACSPEAAPVEGDDVIDEQPLVFVVGTNTGFHPFEFIDDDGNIVGFDIDMAQYIADYLGAELQVEDMAFDSLVTAITGNKIDAAFAAMSITEEKLLMVNFSDPYYDSTQVIVVPEGSDITGVADLAGKTVGVQLGTTGDEYVSAIEGCTVAQYNTITEAAMDMQSGKIDAVVVDEQPAIILAESFDAIVLEEALSDESYAIALSKDDTELLADINAAIAQMKSDGTYDELLAKYELTPADAGE